jgi:hypothetical protein
MQIFIKFNSSHWTQNMFTIILTKYMTDFLLWRYKLFKSFALKKKKINLE